MSAVTAQRPSRSLSVEENKVGGNFVKGNELRTGTTSSNSSGSGSSYVAGPSNSGILCNAHEAPPKTGKMDGGIGSKLKAAFTHQQPDPRGPDAPVGDGVVLSSGETSDDEAQPGSPSGQSSSNDGTADSDNGSNGFLSPGGSQTNRARSNTASTELSDSGSSVCKIKFAPLPTSGRLKRANSITIGVAARSQLLQSQGSGRQAGNAAAWQQQQQQRQNEDQHGRQNDQYTDGSRYSGIQPTQDQSQDPVDLGEEIRKGASKAWNRFRRGSSVSSSGSSKSDLEQKEKSPPARKSHRKKTKSQLWTLEQEKRLRSAHKVLHTSTAVITKMKLILKEHKHRVTVCKDVFRLMSYEDAERQNEATRFIEMLGHTGAGKEIYHHADSHRKKEYKVKRDDQGKLIEVVGIDEKGSEMDTSSESERSRSTGTHIEEDEDDEETREAEELADRALKGHSEKALRLERWRRWKRRELSIRTEMICINDPLTILCIL
ncbi:hypothetical protein L7F22_043687 [Adiantum nelumboides]|nr:hypothetical protein [Adiantum nelumboides]